MYLQLQANAMMVCKSDRSNKASNNSMFKRSFRTGEYGGKGIRKQLMMAVAGQVSSAEQCL